jgi:predicted nucleotidyltransferase
MLGNVVWASTRSGDCATVASMSVEVEIVGGPAPLSLPRLRARIGEYLGRTSVVRAIIFGSYARGEADAVSDLDLLLIEPTALPFLERGRRHLELFRMGVGVDLLVYTPDEFDRLRSERHPLIERIEREGVVVYARSEGRGAAVARSG